MKKYEGQIKLERKIIKDYKSLFCIIFHGRKGKNGLPTEIKVIFSKKIDNLNIETELQQVVIDDKD